jgi:PhnB protein
MAAKKKKKAAKAKATTKPKAKAKAKPKAKKKVHYIPPGYGTVTAALNLTDAKLTIDFCKKVFGGKVRMTMPGPGGKLLHAELEIGDSVVMLSDAMQDPPRVSSLFLYVPSADKTMAKALAAGAKVIMPLSDMFWGDRFGRFVDPQGNFWSIATHVEDVSPKEMQKRSAAEAARMAAGSN